MSGKNITNQQNQYNQPSLNSYQSLAAQSGSQLNSQISNPYNNSVTQGQRAYAAPSMAAGASTARMSQGNQQGALGTSGGTNYSGQAGIATNRFNAGQFAQTGNSILLGAAQNRNQALGSAMNFRPLQTGGSQQQFSSGTGTWLPTVIGTAINAASTFVPGLKNVANNIKTPQPNPPQQQPDTDPSDDNNGGDDGGGDDVWGMY